LDTLEHGENDFKLPKKADGVNLTISAKLPTKTTTTHTLLRLAKVFPVETFISTLLHKVFSKLNWLWAAVRVHHYGSSCLRSTTVHLEAGPNGKDVQKNAVPMSILASV